MLSKTRIGKPRGVLRPDPSAGRFVHERRPPPSDLAPFVEHFWMVSWDVEEPAIREVLPHPSVHVVLERGLSQVAGVPRGRFTRRLEGRGLVFGIKFRPGGFRPYVAFPISRITGRTLPLEDIFGEGSEALEDAVLLKPVMRSMIQAATKFLRLRKPPRDPLVEEVGLVMRRILEDREIRRVEDLVRIVGGGTRSLQRLFSEYVGVSPKWVILRYRLHEAIERMDAGSVVDWTSLSLDLGYFDQAHFIRDFKALVGRTPGHYGRVRRGGA